MREPPAGLEPAASGLRARWLHAIRPRGHESSGGRARTCALAINSRASSRLDHAGTKEAEAAGLEPANGSCRLRGSNALPSQLGHASASGRRGSRTSKLPLKRRELCPLSYGAVSVTGRGRTCDAPRFRRALYRAELRSRVDDGRSRSRTGGLLRIREALCHLSYPPSGRGWARTSSLLCVRQALSPVELLARRSGPGGSRTLEPPPQFAAATTTARLLCRALSYPAHGFRDKCSNLGLHVQSVAPAGASPRWRRA